ncbi:MAG: hypothetical protein A3F72_11500 [Bacteroidetes bacterium RIFCSPLOWO2_12_FULL_35_15]|nr:MAG: hypothetical protein A3F72_11500 [Bacteroidetes bacterium RIFCSPLOWO2_12_FULL_35_15]
MVEAIKAVRLIDKSGAEKKLLENKYSKLANDEAIRKTMEALLKNGITSFVFVTVDEVKKKLFELLPENAEVMDMTSVTLKKLGISDEIFNSGKYDSLRKKLGSLDDKLRRKLSCVADFSIGSVHAVTLNGEILIASATGSQLAAYAYGSGKVIWIVGTQKIVKDREEGMKRLYEYCLPLENERAKKVYKSPSKMGKILTINSETPGRLTILFIKQNIGF